MDRLRLEFLVFALSLPLVACSDDSSSSSTSNGGSSGSAAVGGAGSGGGGSTGISPATLFPLASGNSWTYDVTLSTADTLCEAGTHQVTATGPATYEGKQAFAVTDLCGGADAHFAIENGEVSEWVEGFWATALKAPVEEGPTWITDGTSTFSWKKAGSVTVAAGSFQNCWERSSSDQLQFTKTFCPEVGLVKATTAGRTAELTAYAVP